MLVKYSEDKPSDCKHCYFWIPGKKKCKFDDCSKRKQIRIAGDDKPKDIVYGQFMKLEANHIRYVLEVMEKASNIRNTKQYILTALYNATLTINSYYTMQYNDSCEDETQEKKTRTFSYFSNETKNEELLKQILQGS